MRGVLKNLEAKKRLVDKRLDEKRQEPSKEEVEIQQAIATLKLQEQAAASNLAAATTRVVELNGRIRSLAEEGSLVRFLVDRTHSEDNRKHLGLISTIRRDFDALHARLLAERTQPGEKDDPRRVDRIVLYIDDLDRCPAPRVIEVLQAVHLLLAYRLFVVVVGVDPRWLLHSLEVSFTAFEQIADGHNWQATAQSYLEKIFQIPFHLRPMTESGYGQLVEGLLTPTEPPEAEAASGHASPTPSSPPSPPTAHTPAAPSPIGAASADAASPASSLSSSSGAAPAPAQSVAARPPRAFVVHEEALTIKPWEVAFAKQLYALIPTPRAVKRFTNVYRLLKAPVRRADLADFEGIAEMPGQFRVPMLLLAILIGAPAEATALFARLQAAQSAAELREALAPTVPQLASAADLPLDPELFARWLPRVERFSFDLGRPAATTTES